ncbi:hypothetical protein [Oceanicaulis sp. MMSF_3324]|uniref:hypothetical protein n=1 Tax=Oceanicaulis sp. MMSF_3324 TaxID=3046702 RepID=UPI00273D5A31|nr:hypothetical protein [Oceanicaulis sp. MMSF_3324]
MKTAMILTAAAALAGLSAGAFTQTPPASETQFVQQTADGKTYYMASTLLSSRLMLEDGQVQIKDLLLDETGNLQAVVVNNPHFLSGDAAIAADLVYRAGGPGRQTLRADFDSTDFELLSQGAGYRPIGLGWASEYDNARSVNAMMGTPISVSASSEAIAVGDVEISVGGAVMAVHFESQGWAAFDTLEGRLPVSTLQFDHDQPDGWTVAANVNDAQLDALAGRDTALFLSAASAS